MVDPPSSTSRPSDVGSHQPFTGLALEPSEGGCPKRWRRFYAVPIASLTLDVVGAAAFVAQIMQKGGVRHLFAHLDLHGAEQTLLPFQADWRARFRKLPNTEAEIVFVGDSLIADGPCSEIYGPIKTYGIGGQTTIGLLDRFDEVAAPES